MRKLPAILAALALLVLPEPVQGHAFGQTYTLPVPLWLFFFGGGAALVVSFLLVGFFVGEKKREFTYSKAEISKHRIVKALTGKWSRSILAVGSVVVLLLVILSGFIGSPTSSMNFSPTFFWVIFLLGFTYLTAIVGDVWSAINPWGVMTRWAGRLYNVGPEPMFRYPKRIGYTPALITYFLLIWVELISGPDAVSPQFLSDLALTYTAVTLIGILLFGKDAWLKYGEFFSIFFRIIGKIALVETEQGGVYLRPPLVGLLKQNPDHPSMVVFVLFMLSSTAFDGFRSTSGWTAAVNFLRSLQPSLATTYDQASQTGLLLLALAFFLAVYLGIIFVIKLEMKTSSKLSDLATGFAFSLVPIALVYNIAHYYTLLLIQGQYIIPLMSDPFGLGWNLFKTIDYTVNVGIVGAAFVWYSQVAFIILGHIAAVYLAHIVSLRAFSTRGSALRSQVPMLALMVTYTITGLWILRG